MAAAPAGLWVGPLDFLALPSLCHLEGLGCRFLPHPGQGLALPVPPRAARPPHFESTFELPGLNDFKTVAKFISNPGNYSIIFSSAQVASDFLATLRKLDPDQRLLLDPSTGDRRRIKLDTD